MSLNYLVIADDCTHAVFASHAEALKARDQARDILRLDARIETTAWVPTHLHADNWIAALCKAQIVPITLDGNVARIATDLVLAHLGGPR